MAFIIEHTKLGFCWHDLLALIVLIAVIAIVYMKRRSMKKEEEELEEQLSKLYADETVKVQEQPVQ